jgi:hypothetical protein
MQTKATISLENRKKWRVLKQPAGLRRAFHFYKHDCCNLDVPINQSLTIFIQISNRNTKFIGA